jgi:hypothetical protein
LSHFKSFPLEVTSAACLQPCRPWKTNWATRLSLVVRAFIRKCGFLSDRSHAGCTRPGPGPNVALGSLGRFGNGIRARMCTVSTVSCLVQFHLGHKRSSPTPGVWKMMYVYGNTGKEKNTTHPHPDHIAVLILLSILSSESGG